MRSRRRWRRRRRSRWRRMERWRIMRMEDGDGEENVEEEEEEKVKEEGWRRRIWRGGGGAAADDGGWRDGGLGGCRMRKGKRKLRRSRKGRWRRRRIWIGEVRRWGGGGRGGEGEWGGVGCQPIGTFQKVKLSLISCFRAIIVSNLTLMSRWFKVYDLLHQVVIL